MSKTASRKCWMCGAPANSREHRIKRSDLIRRYGNQPFLNIGGMLHVADGEAYEVQGPSAKRLTYEPIICSECNNVKSQPWDKAYQKFERWVFENSRLTLQRRFILLEEVFGEDSFPWECPALYKYFVKAFGCRLANAGITVPLDLVTLLPRDQFLTKLRLTFAVNKTVFAMEPRDRELYLGLGDLIRIDSRSLGKMARYEWHIQVGWLRVWFFYDIEAPCGLGSVWTSDSACIYLGEFETASLDQLIENARKEGAPALVHFEALRERGGIKVE